MPSGQRYTLEILNSEHTVEHFACGDEEIDEYFRESALSDTELGLARTFVEIDQEKPATSNVAGFFTLRAHALSIYAHYFDDIGNHEPAEDDTQIEVPLIELMYLARDLRWKGAGLGDTLIIDALRMVAEAANRIGFIGVHLRSTPSGTPLYENYDFRPFEEHPYFDGAHYILPTRDVLAIVGALK